MSMALMDGKSVDRPGLKVLMSARPDSGITAICLLASAFVGPAVGVVPAGVPPPHATSNIASRQRNVGSKLLARFLPDCIGVSPCLTEITLTSKRIE